MKLSLLSWTQSFLFPGASQHDHDHKLAVNKHKTLLLAAKIKAILATAMVGGIGITSGWLVHGVVKWHRCRVYGSRVRNSSHAFLIQLNFPGIYRYKREGGDRKRDTGTLVSD